LFDGHLIDFALSVFNSAQNHANQIQVQILSIKVFYQTIALAFLFDGLSHIREGIK
jgi:hypothetical protein